MADETDIRKALEKRLKNASGVPSNIAWENGSFSPSHTDTWLRTKLVPNTQRPGGVGVGVAQKHMGLFLIDCFVRQDKTTVGPANADNLALLVKSIFPYGLTIVENTLQVRIRFSERGPALDNAPWYLAPVTVNWYTYIGEG